MHTLKESKLTLEDGVLIKKNSDGQEVASINLESIDKVYLTEKIDFSIVMVTLVLISSTVAVYLNMPNGWMKVCAIIVLGILSVIMLFAIKTTTLVIKTGGNDIEFPISDSNEDAQAFFVMLDQRRIR